MLEAPLLSVTMRLKTKLVLLVTDGAVKVGDAALALLSVTAVPLVCDQL